MTPKSLSKTPSLQRPSGAAPVTPVNALCRDTHGDRASIPLEQSAQPPAPAHTPLTRCPPDLQAPMPGESSGPSTFGSDDLADAAPLPGRVGEPLTLKPGDLHGVAPPTGEIGEFFHAPIVGYRFNLDDFTDPTAPDPLAPITAAQCGLSESDLAAMQSPRPAPIVLGESELADFTATRVSPSPGHDPRLPPDLAHAPGIPALPTQLLAGKDILIENIDGEPIGLVWARYRSLVKSFLIGTGATYERDVTEQTGTDVWRKVWRDSKTRGYTHLLRQANFLVLQLDPCQERRYKWAKQAFVREPIDYGGVLGHLIETRQRHQLPTWVFTPRRLDSPEFIEVYGAYLAERLRDSFSPLYFGNPDALQLTR